MRDIGKAWSEYLEAVRMNEHGTVIGKSWKRVVDLLNAEAQKNEPRPQVETGG